MSTDNHPPEAAEDPADPAAIPPGSRVAAWLTLLRSRFARMLPAKDVGDAAATTEAGGESAAPSEAVTDTAEPGRRRIRTLLHLAAATVAGALLGGIGGALFSYELFAGSLGAKSAALEKSQQKTTALTLELNRAKRAEAEYRENLAEARRALASAQQQHQRSLANAHSRRSNEPPRLQSPSARNGQSQRDAVEQSPVECNVSAADPGASLARCLGGLNR